jgi:hypothetical protein
VADAVENLVKYNSLGKKREHLVRAGQSILRALDCE